MEKIVCAFNHLDLVGYNFVNVNDLISCLMASNKNKKYSVGDVLTLLDEVEMEFFNTEDFDYHSGFYDGYSMDDAFNYDLYLVYSD